MAPKLKNWRKYLSAKLTAEEQEIFNEVVGEVLSKDCIWQLDDYTQHGSVTRLEHSLAVAYYSLVLYHRFGYSGDERTLLRGALLHDFFLYDWRSKEGENARTHGFTHPVAALENACLHFDLNEREKDIIRSHMWPLAKQAPKYVVSYIVSMADKACATTEAAKVPYRQALAPINRQLLKDSPPALQFLRSLKKLAVGGFS